MRHHGFILDVDRCTGCAACVVACSNENSPTRGIAWRNITTFNRHRLPGAPVFHFSLSCNHCLDPACMAACPADAYRRDETTGAVLIETENCIGCRYCTWVCPYEAPRLAPATGVMEKCTLCHHRVADEMEPACVVACPVDALAFETVEEPPAVSRAGFPETGLRPAIRIVGERRTAAPEMTAAANLETAAPQPRNLGRRGLRAEWSLWFFTSIITFLVAWFTAATAGHGEIPLTLFAVTGAVALGASALHLGRPARAWRGILNWKRSWISREALLVVFFLAGACAFTGVAAPRPAALWATAATGFAALFAMDMVYRVPGQSPQTVPHSAMATLTAAYYLGLWLANPALALPAAVLKLVLYVVGRRPLAAGGFVLGAVRVVVGLVLPIVVLFTDSLPLWAAVALAAIGELIDRAEFYIRLKFLTPEVQAARDLSTFSSSSGEAVG